MVTQFYKKYDLTYAENLPVVKEAISGEQHIIPQEAPFVITLKHLPQLSDPSSVFVDGFTEVSKDPQSDEFVVDYVNNSGVIEFNPTNAGQSVNISYNAVGTVVWAETYLDGREGINKIQDAINAVEIVVDDHLVDASNPHNISADQINAVSRFGDVILGALKTQDIVVQSGYNILPEVALGSSLGTIDKPFSDVFVGPGSLYIDGIEVISSTETTLDISTSTDQHMAVSTSGLGTTRLASAKEVFIWSGQDINVQNLNNLGVLTGGANGVFC